MRVIWDNKIEILGKVIQNIWEITMPRIEKKKVNKKETTEPKSVLKKKPWNNKSKLKNRKSQPNSKIDKFMVKCSQKLISRKIIDMILIIRNILKLKLYDWNRKKCHISNVGYVKGLQYSKFAYKNENRDQELVLGIRKFCIRQKI